MRALVGIFVAFAVVVAGAKMLRPSDPASPDLLPPHLLRLEEGVTREPTVASIRRLASAYLQEAQRGGGMLHHARAEQACERLLAMDGETSHVLALKAVAQAGQHRFREAVGTARRSIELDPALPEAWGALADGLIELGEYEQAVGAVQRMLDLKPSAAAYARAAYVRSLHGDQAGGLRLMELAVEASAPAADRQWMLVHLANDQLAAGRTSDALGSYREILFREPDNPTALAGLARIAAAGRDYEKAAQMFERVLAEDADPDAHVALADVLAVLGRQDEANRHYETAEALEREELRGPGRPEYRHLALLLADRGIQLDEALRLARLDAAGRDDVYTADTLAWTLFRNGQIEDAAAATTRAMRLGTNDPILLFHAGMIAAARGDREASSLLRRALKGAAVLGPRRIRETRQALQDLETI